MIKIVVDMMGGDNGSKPLIEAVSQFLEKHDDAFVYAVGKTDDLDVFKNNSRVKILPANTVVPMECSVMQAMRSKDSSVYVAVSSAVTEKADAVISAGSTGAFLSLCTLIAKKMDGVERPALITPFPTKVDDKYVVFLDVGASAENSADDLVQFAKMGSAYCKAVYGNENPKVSLICNGTEEGKGNSLSKEAYEKLKDYPNFKGYIEGRDAFSGDTDVVVFDGFTGNIFLKGCEGLAKMMGGMMKEAFLSSFSSKMGYVLAKKGFSKMLRTMDYKKVGGALLVGVNVVSIKAHGNADVESFTGSLNIAYNLAKNEVLNKIRENLKQ